jgi:hypothetical protein
MTEFIIGAANNRRTGYYIYLPTIITFENDNTIWDSLCLRERAKSHILFPPRARDHRANTAFVLEQAFWYKLRRRLHADASLLGFSIARSRNR